MCSILSLCHSVSNDGGGSQAILRESCAWASDVFVRRHFALAEKILCVTGQGFYVLAIAAVRLRPHYSSLRDLLPPLLHQTPRHCGEAGCPLKAPASAMPPRNDSGLPALRPWRVARNSSLRTTSGTTAWPACVRRRLSPDKNQKRNPIYRVKFLFNLSTLAG